jgi:hypothetical protein
MTFAGMLSAVLVEGEIADLYRKLGGGGEHRLQQLDVVVGAYQ